MYYIQLGKEKFLFYSIHYWRGISPYFSYYIKLVLSNLSILFRYKKCFYIVQFIQQRKEKFPL